MRTAEQLKGKIRNYAKETGLMSQEILQMYLFERVIDRLSKSKYKDNFVLKGGFLIASMIGINERTTMDMDTTVQGLPMNEDTIASIWKEIFMIDVADGIDFIYDRITPIREDDDYNNFRIFFFARQGKINNPMRLDITTGDRITPAAIEYNYRTIFDDGTIPVRAYNLETIIAEKYETIIRRNIGTTRARDFYDLHILYKLYKSKINFDILKMAIRRTSEKRKSIDEIQDWKEIINELQTDAAVEFLWENYRKENIYAANYSYKDVMETLGTIGSSVN